MSERARPSFPALAAATDRTRSSAEKALIKFSAKSATTESASGSGEVERTAEISEIAQVHGLDRHRSLDLPGETTLPARVSAVADDQDLRLARRVHRGCRVPQRIVLPAIELNPLHAAGCGPKIDRFACRKVGPYRQQPIAQIVRSCVVPPPRGREFSRYREERHVRPSANPPTDRAPNPKID